MGLEGGVVDLGDLNVLWPLATDERSTADDHLRNIKVAVTSLLTFPGGLAQLGFPASVAAGAGKALVVNSGLTAYELGGPYAAASLFPSPTANAGKILKVNSGGTAFDLLTQGTGGTLDADTLDGSHAAAFGIPNANQSAAQTGGALSLTATRQNIPGATITIAASGTYLVLAWFAGFTDASAGSAMGFINNNGAESARYWRVSETATLNNLGAAIFDLQTLVSGQVIKLQAFKSIDGGTAQIVDSYLVIIRLA